MKKVSMGREKPLSLSSFILLSPDAFMKLDGESMSGWMSKIGHKSTSRHMQRLMADPRLTLSKVKHGIAPLLAPLTLQARHPLFIEFRSALASEAAAEKFNEYGFWWLYRQSWEPHEPDGSSGVDHFILIEGESKAVDLALAAQDYAKAAALGQKSDFLRPYLTEIAWKRLATATSPKEALPSRTAGVVDAIVSNWAWIEVLLQKKHACSVDFSPLMTIVHEKDIIKWLMRTLCRELGVSQAEFYQLGCSCNEPVDERSVKRWFSGGARPTRDRLSPMVQKVISHLKTKEGKTVYSSVIGAYYVVATRLIHVLRLLQPLLGEAAISAAGKEWTTLIGHDSFSEYLVTRYAYWREHWNTYERPQAENHIS